MQKAPGNVHKPALVNITYLLSVILTAVWVVGYFFLHAGNAIHLLLAMAMFIIVVNIIRGA